MVRAAPWLVTGPSLPGPAMMPELPEGKGRRSGGHRPGDPQAGISRVGSFPERHPVHQQPRGRRAGIEPTEYDS